MHRKMSVMTCRQGQELSVMTKTYKDISVDIADYQRISIRTDDGHCKVAPNQVVCVMLEK